MTERALSSAQPRTNAVRSRPDKAAAFDNICLSPSVVFNSIRAFLRTVALISHLTNMYGQQPYIEYTRKPGANPIVRTTPVHLFRLYSDLPFLYLDCHRKLDTFRSLLACFQKLIVRFNLHGKKLNPHQSYEDRSRQVETVSRSLAYLSIVMSLFFIYNAAGDVYALKAYEHVAFSAYFQIIAFISIGNIIWGLPLKNLNFDVYKADVSAK
ncbi:MAG: hypothetical protein V7744_21085 [Pseudomonadales bacterium]